MIYYLDLITAYFDLIVLHFSCLVYIASFTLIAWHSHHRNCPARIEYRISWGSLYGYCALWAIFFQRFPVYSYRRQVFFCLLSILGNPSWTTQYLQILSIHCQTPFRQITGPLGFLAFHQNDRWWSFYLASFCIGRAQGVICLWLSYEKQSWWIPWCDTLHIPQVLLNQAI